MPRPVRHALILLLPFTLVAPACGDSGGSGTGPGPGPSITRPSLPSAVTSKQERIELSAFQADVSGDGDFGAVAAGMTATDAGVVETSDGVTVTWGEGGGLAAVRVRDANGCTYFKGTRKAGGFDWTNASGGAATPPTIARPELLKQLVGFDLDDRTTVVSSALSTDSSVEIAKADLPTVDFRERRFVAYNTFGPLLGTDMSVLTGIASAKGGFDRAEAVDYAQEDDILEALTDLDQLDVMVWFAQGVRQETQGGGRAHRTVGLTVNRGGYGETIMTRDTLRDGTGKNVGGGPGVIILAASNSYSDGQADPDVQSLWNRLVTPGCAFVGVEGHADAADILYATMVFLDRYLSGETTFGDALAAANDAISGTGAALRTNLTDTSRTWVATTAQVWDEAPFTPSAVKLTVPFTAVPFCAPVGQPKQATTTSFTTAFADITFDGINFEGTREFSAGGLDVTNTLRGSITGFEPGDRVFVEAFGDFDTDTRGFHGFGEGVIDSVDTDRDTGKVTINFTGLAHATEFNNAAGDECLLNNPRLSTTTSSPATLELTP